jgi:D-tagatose-1,6-bisphosphate aldolase subunit GatZ/KbaZ
LHEHHLRQIVKKQKSGIAQGICSICSANRFVFQAALEHGRKRGTVVLIESTSNQVNQYGGYTGMTPQDFIDLATSTAREVQFSLERLILGGDHLGPNPWKNEPAGEALQKACVLVRDYVYAGFTKIHLDASMHLADDAGDRSKPLDPKIVAERTAPLCEAAEAGYLERLKEVPDALVPVYVIGTEVPVPGGVQGCEAGLSVTTAGDFSETVQLTRAAFAERGLEEVWERVVGVVVQPGVEFGDDFIHEYDRDKARELSQEVAKYPNVVFEGHSTDYQTPQALRQLVEDGVAILKVGPELTYAFREALFLLEHIERELFAGRDAELSDLKNVLLDVMLSEPGYWEPYYRGEGSELEFTLKYSLSDRIRYYWPHERAAETLAKLIANLDSVDIPLALVSQYMPVQYRKIRAGEIQNKADDLIKDRIAEVLEKYRYATQPQ